MNTLLPSHSGHLVWSLETIDKGIDFKLRLIKGKWVADAPKIEAALPLWLCSVHGSEQQHEDVNNMSTERSTEETEHAGSRTIFAELA